MFVFFFNDTATTEIYTLSLHDALPIWRFSRTSAVRCSGCRSTRTSCSSLIGRRVDSNVRRHGFPQILGGKDRKSTRLNSSRSQISYAVFCLKKKTIKLDDDLTITAIES